MKRSHTLALLAAVAAIGVTACTVRPPPCQFGQTASIAPPPPRVEVIPPPPMPPEREVWAPGHWRWDGRDYAWESGHYIARPSAEAAYEPGRWVQTADGGWAWMPGHWR